MNPLTNMKNVKKLSEQQLHGNSKTTWHDEYSDSAWIFVGGLPFDLTEGDIICIFSQYGEIVNIDLARAKDTGKSLGHCRICYEDQRSTNLAVDNLNGIKVLNRTIRVDHVKEYRIPKSKKGVDEITKKLREEGCAPKAQIPQLNIKKEPRDELRETLADQIDAELKLPRRLPIFPVKKEKIEDDKVEKKIKKEKKHKKKKKKSKKKKHKSSESEDESEETESDSAEEKKEKNKHSSDVRKNIDSSPIALKKRQRSRSHSPRNVSAENERKFKARKSRSRSRDKETKGWPRSISNDRNEKRNCSRERKSGMKMGSNSIDRNNRRHRSRSVSIENKKKRDQLDDRKTNSCNRRSPKHYKYDESSYYDR